MIAVDDFLGALDRYGFRFHTGVPCSFFTGAIAELTRRGCYVAAANEGAAVALATGATATGIRAGVFAQNSGFGNLLNPLTSLVMPYRAAVLVFMSLRGWPDPDADEPQHRVMGATTHALLDTLGVRHWTLRESDADVEEALAPAVAELAEGRPAFVLFQKGALATEPVVVSGQAPAANGSLSRTDGLRVVVEHLSDALLVSTTGYASRELHALADSEQCFYMQGSMGHASAFGLGVALGSSGRRKVVVLDGDGAALMHLGSMSTVGAVAPENLVHVIFDNGSYESTGGQATTSPTTSFAGVARAVGYRSAVACSGEGDLAEALDRAAASSGPHLVVIRTAPCAGPAPPRATAAISAPEIHARFAAAAAAAA